MIKFPCAANRLPSLRAAWTNFTGSLLGRSIACCCFMISRLIYDPSRAQEHREQQEQQQAVVVEVPEPVPQVATIPNPVPEAQRPSPPPVRAPAAEGLLSNIWGKVFGPTCPQQVSTATIPTQTSTTSLDEKLEESREEEKRLEQRLAELREMSKSEEMAFLKRQNQMLQQQQQQMAASYRTLHTFPQPSPSPQPYFPPPQFYNSDPNLSQAAKGDTELA